MLAKPIFLEYMFLVIMFMNIIIERPAKVTILKHLVPDENRKNFCAKE